MAKKPSKVRRAKASPARGEARRPVPKAKKSARPAAKRIARPAPRPAARRPAAPPPSPVRELAKRIVDLTVAGNDEAAFALYADNVESVEMNMPPSTGIEAIKRKFAMWRGMVSQSSWTARNVWVDGNAIIIEWEGVVTLAASGKVVTMREVAIHEVQNGKIVRERFYYDPAVLQP